MTITEPWLMSHDGFGGLVGTIVWQATLFLTAGLLSCRLLRRRAARAHGVLVLATAAALLAPVLTETIRWMEWGILPASASAAGDAAARTADVATGSS